APRCARSASPTSNRRRLQVSLRRLAALAIVVALSLFMPYEFLGGVSRAAADDPTTTTQTTTTATTGAGATGTGSATTTPASTTSNVGSDPAVTSQPASDTTQATTT